MTKIAHNYCWVRVQAFNCEQKRGYFEKKHIPWVAFCRGMLDEELMETNCFWKEHRGEASRSGVCGI